ncbi:MAG: HD domain-containing phosphohydrolase [Planctomycetota bacterium]
MSTARIDLILPEELLDFARHGPLREALEAWTRSAGTPLAVHSSDHEASTDAIIAGEHVDRPVTYRGRIMGLVRACGAAPAAGAQPLVMGLGSLLDHMLEREMAIGDLAGALATNYEHLHVFQSLLSSIAARTDAHEIGELLVAEVAGQLHCRRVSLLVLDEKREQLKVLAARGLPRELLDISIPVISSVAGRTLVRDGLLVVDDMTQRPDLAALSWGDYTTNSFAVIRMPLHAHAHAVGVIAATERIGVPEFTTRDCQLFEGISAIGASALLNCRLHTVVNQQMLSTIRALATAVDAKDRYTHDHSARVARLCVATARRLGLNDPEKDRVVELAGLLHDIGKIGIPDRILGKTSRLTPEEYHIMKTHAHIGANIIQQVPGLEDVANAVLHHHERYDGLGYPRGLAGEAIPLGSRLIAAADVFDSLTSDRPYRQRSTQEEVVRELRRCKGTQHDPAVVEALIAVVKAEGELGEAAEVESSSTKCTACP